MSTKNSYAEHIDLNQLCQTKKVDSLLETLSFLSKYYQRAVSKVSLTSGFAIHENSMSINNFIDSAKRIGLISKIVTRELTGISKLALPTVLLLEKGRACILLKVDLYEATVIIPGLSEGEIVISIDELKKEFTGKVIIIKPTYNFNNRISDNITIEKPKSWFFGALKRNTMIYQKVIVAAIMINIFVLATPLFMKNVFDRVLPNNAIETMWAMAFGIFIIMIFDFVLKLLRAHYIGKAGKRADVVMSNRIFDQVLNIQLDEKPASTGQFVNRLQSFESLRDFFTSATVATIVDVPFILLFIAIIFYFGGILGWIPVFAMIFTLIFTFFIQKKTKGISQESAKEDQLKQSTLNEAVSGLEIIKSVKAHNRMKAHWDQALIQTTYFNEKLQFLSQVNSFFTAFIAQLSNILIIIVGIYLAIQGEATMGGIVAAMMLNGRVLSPLGQIVSMILRYEKSMIALNNIDEIMEMDTEKKNKNYLSRPHLHGNIEFKDVFFHYKDQKYDVLNNINLTIKEGEKVAILGKIGSGKSTLAKLIMNLYSPTKGSVLVDKTDVRQIDPSDLRQSMGCVPQEAFLFMGSIKDNITIGEQYVSDEELIAVAKLAGVHDFLGKHEAGYDLIVGERGEGLSGGERQSVTLARALVSNPEILIMDEPTNSMDKQTETQFINRIKSIIDDKTLIVVTHKMALLTLVDRVIIIDNGKIVADGPKEKVLSPKGKS
ncbi:MAG: type I secretion system permease/ATPase [Campylobacterota bacterium]|nr:type I secretion system permease/ATPase [Campylobacterota bacterium]